MTPNIQMPSTKAVISATASVATAVLIRSRVKDFIAGELRRLLLDKIYNFFATFTKQVTVVIKISDGLDPNKLFKAAEAQFCTLTNPSAKKFFAKLSKKEKKIKFFFGRNEEITDKFNGFQVTGKMVKKRKEQSNSESTVRSLELRFHRKHKDEVFDDYLTHILKKRKAANKKKKELRMFTVRLDGYSWESVNFDHPATFDTLAMDLNLKKDIIDDLERFVQRKKLYRRVGKAWKRGYLLYGPPGTGKSTLIAAMANHLGFDVYDLELTAVRSDSDLRRLLIRTANRSIIVVEDIDCSLSLDSPRTAPPRRVRSPPPVKDIGITLSGLLNFNDGLWSSCGDERIIVFTTNHKDRLDPALLCPGRMDLHIHMSYCSRCVFKMLASKYLGITEHPLFLEIEELIEMMKVTPAEIGELLLKDNEPDIAVRALIEFHKKKKENEETRANVRSP